jgi:nucleoid DNA-binding protein
MIPNDSDVDAFIDGITNPVRKRDARTLLELMTRVTGETARLWGPTIVGFGAYHYRYATGREGDAPATGFSPRKAATTVYLADGTDAHDLSALGEHTTGVGCLYLKNVDRVDLSVLESVVARSYATAASEGFGQVD